MLKLFAGDLLKYTEQKTEEISSLLKRFFWTVPQYSILKDDSQKRVIFMSDFGTGKTSLLKAKAKILLGQKKNIVFISFEDKESHQDSLLTIQLKDEFQSKVHSIRGSGNYYPF